MPGLNRDPHCRSSVMVGQVQCYVESGSDSRYGCRPTPELGCECPEQGRDIAWGQRVPAPMDDVLHKADPMFAPTITITS